MTIRLSSFRPIFIALIWIVAGGVGLLAQNSAAAKPTGLFGRLEYHKEAGDVVGLEVFIMKGRSGHRGVIQIAEGVPEDPVLVPVRVDGTVLSFEMRSGNETLHYKGTVRPDGLYGKFDNGAFSDRADGFFLLKRGHSYWQD